MRCIKTWPSESGGLFFTFSHILHCKFEMVKSNKHQAVLDVTFERWSVWGYVDVELS